MRLAWKILATLLAGTVLGTLLTWLMLTWFVPNSVKDGPWRTNLAIGSAQAGLDTRALVALHGLFALNRHEAIYYTARDDSDGRRLDGTCRYEITGHALDARWWSITAYGSDDYLIPNPANRYSISSPALAVSPQGEFTAQVSRTGSGNNWLPVGDRTFSLTLRLYNPGLTFIADAAHAALPDIERIACP